MPHGGIPGETSLKSQAPDIFSRSRPLAGRSTASACRGHPSAPGGARKYNPPMNNLPDNKVREIRESFEYFDRDQNGFIDFDEFTELLKVISPESTVQQAAEGFSIIDTNSDGHVDLEEFITWWKTTWWEF